MDYKIFILLLFFVICIVLFLRELYSIRDDLERLNKDIRIHIEEMNNQLRNKLQNDLGVCVNKIKSLNNDSIQQIRKINILNNQPIKNSNHFTESDSLVNVEHEINSLTEMKNCSPGINTIQDLTLHESNIQKNDSETSSLGINLTSLSDTTENNLKVASTIMNLPFHLEKALSNSLDISVPKMVTTILLDTSNVLELPKNKSYNSLHIEPALRMPPTDSVKNLEPVFSKNTANGFLNKNPEPQQITTVENIQNKDTILSKNEIDNNVMSEENRFEENKDIKINSPIKPIEDSEMLKDRKIIELQNKNKKNMESLKIEIDNEHDSDSLISLNSAKSNKNIQQKPQQRIRLLQPVEKYSYEELKTIAKCNDISLSTVINGKRKLFSKNELYNELETKLYEKNNIKIVE